MRKMLVGLLVATSFVQAARIHYDGPPPENFIIRWAFQELCDHHFDPRDRWATPAPDGKTVSFHPADVKPGDLVFVRDFEYYFTHKHEHIQVPYFVLTHGECLDKFKKKYLKYLDDERILAWFTLHPCPVEHERVIPIPLGVVQFKQMYDNREKTFHNFMKHRARKKDKLLYMNFTEWCMPFRTRIRKLFEHKSFCTYVERCPFQEYLSGLASHKFALSPPGLGPDCYRVWECAMVGVIPIVEHSYFDVMYKGLPVLFIDSWEEITEEFLNEKYEEMTAQTYSQASLSMEYWIDSINKTRKKFWPAEAGPFYPVFSKPIHGTPSRNF